jgi:integrase
MPKLKLTKSGVDKLPYYKSSPQQPKKNQELFWDTELIGFGLRVTETSKTYIVEKRVNRRTVRARIGRHNQVPTDKARGIAQKLIYEMTTGKDVNARKKASQGESITLNQAFNHFLEKRDLKDKTISDYRRVIDTTLKSWNRKRIIDITRNMVAKKHSQIKKDAEENYVQRCKKRNYKPTKEEITKRGGAYGNLCMRCLRSVLNFSSGQYEDGEGKPLIKDNPVSVITQTKTWYRVDRRQTIIKPHQLFLWFDEVNNLNSDLVKDYLILLLFTGLRRQEAMRLEWDQIDLKAKTLTVVDTKNRKPLTLPLGPFILKMLKCRNNNATESNFVFPSTGKTGHLVESKYQTTEVTKKSGVKFCLHDLRRVFINTAESLDISSYAVKQLVNHSMDSDVTSGYMVSDPERLRKPMEKIETQLLRLCRKDKAKVINLKHA